MSKIHDKQVAENCSICGSPVWHHSSDEGTHYYSIRPVTIGQYEILHYHGGTIFIRHESGEGMQVSGKGLDKLEALITQFYADNF